MIVNLKNYDEPEINKKEILRYAGARNDDKAVCNLIDECLNEIIRRLKYKVCWCELPINISAQNVDLSFAVSDSKALKKNLSDCKSIVLFAATIGIEIDRKIAKYSKVSPVKALIFQAIGAERIEALCDKFNDDINNDCKIKGLYTRPRFSPGYGDFKLDAQTEIIKILDCQRKIGLTLNSSLLMSPSKSVTALIGISEYEKKCKEHKCDNCENVNCIYRDR